MRFEDLKFKKQTHGGVGATVEFKDVTVSVQAGSFVYSTPREDLLDSTMYSSFEVAVFDKEYFFEAEDIEPMITYGTNPGMGIKISDNIPYESNSSFLKSLLYMNLNAGESLINKCVNYVFIGSCTNSRIEDFRVAAKYIKGRRKAENVTAWLVPGSKQVEAQIVEEGLKDVFESAGFKLRQPGCSACLAMNEDKIPAGKVAVSTSNRNFEGRQGPGARTMLASPTVAAATAVMGVVTDPRTLSN